MIHLSLPHLRPHNAATVAIVHRDGRTARKDENSYASEDYMPVRRVFTYTAIDMELKSMLKIIEETLNLFVYVVLHGDSTDTTL